jgi:hypothetical protein
VSVFGIEQVLYDISVKRDARERFKQDLQQFLARYPVTDAERVLIAGFCVGELLKCGVSPLLTLGFWMEAEGSRSMASYLRSARCWDDRDRE